MSIPFFSMMNNGRFRDPFSSGFGNVGAPAQNPSGSTHSPPALPWTTTAIKMPVSGRHDAHHESVADMPLVPCIISQPPGSLYLNSSASSVKVDPHLHLATCYPSCSGPCATVHA
ncbi:hypothetical protein T484DRAFT_3647447 [Baffinella frigidus]|nr:hypothetical protein T484DRAFT_3647447 [Cryptophyta sp. CCMP2293]